MSNAILRFHITLGASKGAEAIVFDVFIIMSVPKKDNSCITFENILRTFKFYWMLFS